MHISPYLTNNQEIIFSTTATMVKLATL